MMNRAASGAGALIAIKASGLMPARAMKEKTMESSDIQADAEFSSAERDAVYK